MSATRQLNRRHLRYLTWHSTRMLGGVRRRRAIDDLRGICDAVERLLESDHRLHSYLRDQIQLQHQRRIDQQIDEAIARVYGSPGTKTQVASESW